MNRPVFYVLRVTLLRNKLVLVIYLIHNIKTVMFYSLYGKQGRFRK
jgi:hypothetical protein